MTYRAHTPSGFSIRVFSLLWVLFMAAGCSASAFVDLAQGNASHTIDLDEPAGQTFVAQHAGLLGIDVYLTPNERREGVVVLNVRSEPDSDTNIVTSTLTLEQVDASGFYRFEFPVLPDSHGQYYYLELETDPAGAVAVGAGPGEAYINGSLYQGQQPVDGQLAFRLVYGPIYIAGDLLSAVMAATGYAAIFILLYIIPGLGLLTIAGVGYGRGWTIGWLERLSVAGGLGLSLYPLLFLWTDVIGLRPGMWAFVWLPALAGLIILVIAHRGWRMNVRDATGAFTAWWKSTHRWADLSLLVVMGLVFLLRLLVVRSLEAPLWGDSVQHAVVAQLIDDHSGLFDSWQPYSAYESMTVQFGFHAVVAIFASLIGMSIEKSTLLVGQFVNVLAVLGLYGLAMRLTNGDRWAGVGAVIAAGLVSSMPAFFVNWGRYSQLAGQAILPVALWLLWILSRGRGLNGRAIIVSGLTVAGMALAYYRMVHYYATFVLAWLVFWALPHWGTDVIRLVKVSLSLILIAMISLLLFFPWLSSVLDSPLGEVLTAGLTDDSPLVGIMADYAIWRDIAEYVPPVLLVLSLLAVVWGMIRREWSPLLVGTWALGLALLVAGRLVHVPGANLIINFAIMIALYMPVSLLTGWLFGKVAGSIHGRVAQPGIFVVAVLISVWAAREQVTIVRPEYIMVTRPDVRAMSWIDQNVPSDALFLVEGFSIYNRLSAVGADAGWWIPLLAHRSNTMPPQYAMMNETPTQPGYTQKVVDLITILEDNPIPSPQSLQALCDWGVTHVYIGQGQGLVGMGVTQLFAPHDLLASPEFQPVYHQDRVHVFALNRETCDASQQ